MNRIDRLVVLILGLVALAGVSCGANPKGGTGGGGGSSTGGGTATGGGSGGGGGGGGANNLDFSATGTFSGTFTGGTVTAALTPTVSLAQTQNTSDSRVQLLVTDDNGLFGSSDTGGYTLSSPSGATPQMLSVMITFPGTSASAGTYTNQTSGYCGGVDMTFGYNNGASAEFFVGATGSLDCSLATNHPGTWTLNLTSVTAVAGTGGSNGNAYYTAHGSLSAAMSDGQGGTGTLNLTF